MNTLKRALLTAMAAVFVCACAGCGPKVDLSQINPDTDLFPVMQGSLFGYIDRSGSFVIGRDFNDARDFSEGLAAARKGLHNYGFIDATGGFVIEQKYYDVTSFCEGVAFVLDKDTEQGGLWGAINRQGELILPHSLFEVTDFSEGLALVRGEGGYYFINADMEDAFGLRWSGGHPFSEGRAAVLDITGSYIFIDTTGKQAFAGSFSDAMPFCEGRAAVGDTRTMRWGYIDTAGNYLITPSYTIARQAGEGLCPVYLPDSTSFYRFGYVDFDGTVVIPGQFVDALPFSEGLAAVKVNMAAEADWVTEKDYKWGFINRAGEFVIEPQYDMVTPFKNGVSKVSTGGAKLLLQKHGYITTSGEYIFEPTK